MSNGEEPILQSTGFLLARVGAESRRRFTQTLVGLNLRHSEFAVLITMAGRGATSQADLGDLVGIDPRNLVAVIDGLEAAGLLERTTDPDDRRRHAVRLTRAGSAKLQRLKRLGAELEDEFLRPLTRQDRTRLHRLLLKLL